MQPLLGLPRCRKVTIVPLAGISTDSFDQCIHSKPLHLKNDYNYVMKMCRDFEERLEGTGQPSS